MNINRCSLLLCLVALPAISYCQYPDAATIKKNKIQIIVVSGRSGTDYRLYDENGFPLKGAYQDETFKNLIWTNKIYYNEKSLPDSIVGNYINHHYQYAADGSFTIISKDGIESDTAFYGKDKKIIRRKSSDGSYTKYEYNAKRQLVKSIETNGEDKSVTTYIYNAAGLLQSEKTTGGSTPSAVYSYDKKRLLIKEVKDYGSGSKYTTDYSYKFRE